MDALARKELQSPLIRSEFEVSISIAVETINDWEIEHPHGWGQI